MKATLVHLSLMATAIALSALLCAFVVEIVVPPVPDGFVPRFIGVATIVAWVSGGAYFFTACVWTGIRERQKREGTMLVAVPAFISACALTLAFVVVLIALRKFG